MRLVSAFICILLFSSKLYSKKIDDTCYSIQLGSFDNSSPQTIKQKLPLDSQCRIISKEKNGYTIKCGCDTKNKMRKKLPYYKKIVPGAFLTKTKREFFTLKKDTKSFVKKKSAQKTPFTHIKNGKKDENLSELIYKVFIYNNDLKNAKKIAKKALLKDPDNLIWRKRLADALSWSGERKKALKHYVFIFEKNRRNRQKESVKKIYGGYDIYFKLLNEIYSNPSDTEKIDEFLKTAMKLGILENATAYLEKIYKKTDNPNILRVCAKYHYEIGEKKKALKYLEVLEKKRALDIDNAVILSKIHFERKRYLKSLRSLLSVKHLAKDRDSKYLYLLSDLYSYVGKNDKAAEVLKEYCLKNSCEKPEYDKLISFYARKDPEYVSKISFKAWRLYKDDSYFFAFAKANIQNKKAYEVTDQIKKLSPNDRERYEKNPLYWLILASLDEESDKIDEAVKAYEKALELDPSSDEILNRYGWFLMRVDRPKELQKIAVKIDRKTIRNQSAHILAAAINYRLNRIKKSFYHYKKALRNDPKNMELKLDYANLLKVTGKNEESLKIKKEVYSSLRQRLQKDPNLLKNRRFLTLYLRSSINFIPSESYEKLMKYAKKILDEKRYLDIKISWKLHGRSDEYAAYLSKKLKKPQIWLKLYLSLKKNDTYTMHELLYHYGAILPIEGKIEALIRTKRIAKAKDESFKALNQAPNNLSLYRLNKNIVTQYANNTDFEAGYENQQTLKRSYAKIENTNHVTNSYYLKSALYFAKNSSDLILINDDGSNDFFARLLVKKLLSNGYVEAGAGYVKNLSSNIQYFFGFNDTITKNLTLKIDLQKNTAADETTNLRIQGEKDQVNFGFRYRFNDRLSFETKISSNRYRLRTGEKIGDASKFDFELQQRIKFSYPDILLREYLSIADFSKNELLPKDYSQGGIGVDIATGASQRYGMTWKPYGGVSATYHDRFGLLLGARVGINGGVFGNDRLNLSLNYNKSATDNQDLWLITFSHGYLY